MKIKAEFLKQKPLKNLKSEILIKIAQNKPKMIY